MSSAHCSALRLVCQMVNEGIHSGSVVYLREVTAETVRAICNLHVAKDQEQFVAPNAVSIAQAHFAKHAWFRAIYAGETPVGFVMVDMNTEEGSYFLWRFMIDEKYQKRGYGKTALQIVIDYVRKMPNAGELTLSYHEGEGCPQPFYQKLGFKNTGRIIDHELEMKLVLQ